jgi:hypothetical protein
LTTKLRESFQAYAQLVAQEFMKAKFPLGTLKSEQFKILKSEYYSLLEKNPRKMNIGLDEGAFGKVLLFSVLETIQNGELDQDLLEMKYIEFEKSLAEIPRTNRAWAFLHQFNCGADVIDLVGNFVVRRTTFLERILFNQNNESLWGRTEAQFIIETKPDSDILVEPTKRGNKTRQIKPNFKLRKEILELVTVLRLVHPSWVGITSIHFELALDPSGHLTMDYSFIPSPELFPSIFNSHISNECNLSDEKADYFVKIWNRYRNVSDMGKKERVNRILRSIHRFNNAIMSDELEDMIVDLIIGLEILFKTTGFRMTFYASTLVGLDEIERLQAATLLDRAYRIRSKIVHGGSLEKDGKEVIPRTLNLVSEVLIFALALSGKKELVDIVEAAAYDSTEMKNLVSKLEGWIIP